MLLTKLWINLLIICDWWIIFLFIKVKTETKFSDNFNKSFKNRSNDQVRSRIRRMIGGDRVSIETFPWTVLIISNGRCGGALVDVNWVLTAAHCISSSNPVVYFGIDRHTLAASSINNHRKVVDIHKPSKTYFTTGDIALLRLDRPVPIRSDSTPIRLNDNRKSIMRRWGVVAGFGRNHLKSDQLMAGRFLIESAFLISTRDIIGARSPNYSPCYGDSGSGLVVEKEDGYPSLVGITSSILAAGCQPNHMALFTDVAFYHSWIMHKIESSFTTPWNSFQRRASPPSSTCWPINVIWNFNIMFCNTWFTSTLKTLIAPWRLFF